MQHPQVLPDENEGVSMEEDCLAAESEGSHPSGVPRQGSVKEECALDQQAAQCEDRLGVGTLR